MKKTVYWIIDYYYLLAGKVSMHIYKNPPIHYLNFVVKGKNPVILIPGISNKWGFLKKLGDSLSLAGHPIYVSQLLGPNLLDISASAKIIKKIIDENNLKKVMIIGHSKGGLIGKYLLMNSNKDKRIKRLIAIATPFSGTDIASLASHKSFKELLPKSKIIEKINSNKTVNSKIISIMPVFDNHVWSKNGSFLQGALNIKVPTKGHHKIVFDKSVIKKIIEIISGV